MFQVFPNCPPLPTESNSRNNRGRMHSFERAIQSELQCLPSGQSVATVLQYVCICMLYCGSTSDMASNFVWVPVRADGSEQRMYSSGCGLFVNFCEPEQVSLMFLCKYRLLYYYYYCCCYSQSCSQSSKSARGK